MLHRGHSDLLDREGKGAVDGPKDYWGVGHCGNKAWHPGGGTAISPSDLHGAVENSFC